LPAEEPVTQEHNDTPLPQVFVMPAATGGWHVRIRREGQETIIHCRDWPPPRIE
jgi:hypothetical protein